MSGGTIVAILILLAAFSHLLYRTRRNIELASAIALAMIIRTLLAVTNLVFVTIPGSGRDDVEFHMVAAAWGASQLSYIFQDIGTGKHLYTSLVAIAYHFFSAEKTIPIAVNIWLGGYLVLQTHTASFNLWGSKRSANLAAWVVALFPNLAIYSALVMRELPAICLFMGGVVLLTKFDPRKGNKQIIGVAAFFLAATLLHSGFIVTLIVPVMMMFRGAASGPIPLQLILGRLVALTCIAGIFVYISVSGSGLEKFTANAEDGGGLVDAVANRQTNRDIDNRAAYLVSMQPRNVVDLVWQTPIRIVYFLFTPFPWMIRSALDVFGFFVTSIAMLLLAMIAWQRKAVWRNWKARNLISAGALIVAIFGIGTSNYGTAIRHRAKVIPLLAVLVPVYGFPNQRSRARRGSARERASYPSNAGVRVGVK